jgi:hypothetical protein
MSAHGDVPSTVRELEQALAQFKPTDRVHIDAPIGGDAQITILDRKYRLIGRVELKRDPYA